MFTTQRLPFNHFIKMLQQSTVSATHIENSFWLFVNWSVENFDDKFIQNFEISRMRTATSPNIHFSVHVNFIFTNFDFADFICFSKQQIRQFGKHRQIRNRHTISRSSTREKQSGFGKLEIL